MTQAGFHHQTIARRDFMTILAAAAGASILPASSIAGLIHADVSPIMDWQTIHKAGVHVMSDQSTGGNSLILTSLQQTLLIDTKFAHLGGALLHDAKAFAGPQGEFNLTLINTHHHGDHTSGNGVIVPHAKSYAHKNAIKRIENQLDTFKQAAQSGPTQVRRSKGSDNMMRLAMQTASDSEQWTHQDVVPQHHVQDERLTIKIGEQTVSMHHFGHGHTDNDLVVLLEDLNIVHTGDLVFAGLHPFFDPDAGVTSQGWINSLQAILGMCDQDTKVIPGHGPIGDRQLVQNQLNYIQQLRKQVQSAIDAGIPKSDTIEKSWDFMDGLGFESIRSRAISAVYDELSGS